MAPAASRTRRATLGYLLAAALLGAGGRDVLPRVVPSMASSAAEDVHERIARELHEANGHLREISGFMKGALAR
jgi:hypothetical protein